jgi:hypothetical protein
MLKALHTKPKASLAARARLRHCPIRGDQGRSRDVECVFKKRRYRGSRDREYLVRMR